MVLGSVGLTTILGRGEKLYPCLLCGSSQAFLLVQCPVSDRTYSHFHSSERVDQCGRIVVADRGVAEALRLPVRITGVLVNGMTSECYARGACDGQRTERVTRVREDTVPSAFSLRNSSMKNLPMFPAPTIAKFMWVGIVKWWIGWGPPRYLCSRRGDSL